MFWRKKKAPPPEPDYAVHKLVIHMLCHAVRMNADKVVFGAPPPDELPRKPLEPEKEHAPGDLEVEHQLLENIGIYREPIFSTFPSGHLPVWFRIDGTWHEAEGVPFQLLHKLIEHIEYLFTINALQNPKLKRREIRLTGDGYDLHLYVELWMEANYCWSLTVDVISSQ